jgi:hypothetical protein
MTISAWRTIVIGKPGGAAAGPLYWRPTEPSTVLDWSLDVAVALADVADAIASVTWSLAPSGLAERTVVNLSVSGSVITAWLAGGVGGRTYANKIVLVGKSGRQWEWLVGQRIEAGPNAYPLPTASSLEFGAAAIWPLVVPPPSPALFFDNFANASLWSFPGQVIGTPIVVPAPAGPSPPSPALFFDNAANASLWSFPGQVVGAPIVVPAPPPASTPPSPALFFDNPENASLWSFPGRVVGQPTRIYPEPTPPSPALLFDNPANASLFNFPGVVSGKPIS